MAMIPKDSPTFIFQPHNRIKDALKPRTINPWIRYGILNIVPTNCLYSDWCYTLTLGGVRYIAHEHMLLKVQLDYRPHSYGLDFEP